MCVLVQFNALNWFASTFLDVYEHIALSALSYPSIVFLYPFTLSPYNSCNGKFLRLEGQSGSRSDKRILVLQGAWIVKRQEQTDAMGGEIVRTFPNLPRLGFIEGIR